MSDDQAFTDYVSVLSNLSLTDLPKKRIKLNMSAVRVTCFPEPACECRACADPTYTEPYAVVKDYKVVEGLRQHRCARRGNPLHEERIRKGIIASMGLPPGYVSN